MREIKFRAWDKVNNKWLTSDEIHEIKGAITGYSMKKSPSNFILFNNGFDFDGEKLKYEYVIEWCQYTGLKDRTGKEVFEGDIVRYDDYQGVAEVGFRRIEFVEEVEFKGGCFYPVCNQPPYTFEVIGSIYENPDLLK